MSETTNTNRTIRTNKFRTAGLFLVGTAGALTLTGGFAGTASALTPAPQPNLPIAQPPAKPQPPIGPGVIVMPETPEPPAPQPDVPAGPDQIAQPLPTPDPHPAPHPQGPDVIVDGDGDGGGGGGFDGPDDFTDGDGGGGGFEGPDDFTDGEDDPGLPGPDDFTAPETPDPTVPETTVPEVLDETDTAEDADAEVAAVAVDTAAPGSLAFTGSDLGLAGAGVALLAAGGAAAMIARRRQRGADDTARA